jgi:hypothetical protein
MSDSMVGVPLNESLSRKKKIDAEEIKRKAAKKNLLEINQMEKVDKLDM